MSILSSINQFVVSNSKKAAAGVKSGMNKKTMGKIFGISQLRKVPGALNDFGARAGAVNRIAGAKGFSRKGDLWKAFGKSQGMKAGKSMLGYFGASDLAGQGWGRVGAGAARVGAAGAGMAAADFLNPFGFGWND